MIDAKRGLWLLAHEISSSDSFYQTMLCTMQEENLES